MTIGGALAPGWWVVGQESGWEEGVSAEVGIVDEQGECVRRKKEEVEDEDEDEPELLVASAYALKIAASS